MVSETILHIDEELDDNGRQRMLDDLRPITGGLEARHHSSKPHMLFVAYDDQRIAPHQLVRVATAHGYHAQLVDF